MRAVNLDSSRPAKASDERKESQRAFVFSVSRVGQEHELLNLLVDGGPNIHGNPRDDGIDEVGGVLVEVRNMGVGGDVCTVEGQLSLGELPYIELPCSTHLKAHP